MPQSLADHLRKMSNGRLDIKVYGAGELVGAFEIFDAVSQGIGDGPWGCLLLARQNSRCNVRHRVFGMNAQEMNGWLHHGGGLSCGANCMRYLT